MDPRSHLLKPLNLFHEDGITLREPAIQASQASRLPSISVSSSQNSTSDDGRSSGVHLRREQSSTPMTIDDDVNDTTSSVNATHGTATIRDDEKPFVWGLAEEIHNQGPNRGQNEHAGSLFPFLIIINSSASASTNSIIVNHQAQTHNVLALFNTTTRFTLAVLTALIFLNFGIAIRTICLAHQKATTLKHTKFTLLLTTHIVAVCAALGAVMVRRTPTEALLYFTVIVLLGNMVRREVECFF
jgi:hypothetical protein